MHLRCPAVPTGQALSPTAAVVVAGHATAAARHAVACPAGRCKGIGHTLCDNSKRCKRPCKRRAHCGSHQMGGMCLPLLSRVPCPCTPTPPPKAPPLKPLAQQRPGGRIDKSRGAHGPIWPGQSAHGPRAETTSGKGRLQAGPASLHSPQQTTKQRHHKTRRTQCTCAYAAKQHYIRLTQQRRADTPTPSSARSSPHIKH